MDFLWELADRPSGRRAAALEQMFLFVKEKPELLWREFSRATSWLRRLSLPRVCPAGSSSIGAFRRWKMMISIWMFG
ncbi:hypothetical protein AB0J27_06525 [Micromonospora chokoriensis]